MSKTLGILCALFSAVTLAFVLAIYNKIRLETTTAPAIENGKNEVPSADLERLVEIDQEVSDVKHAVSQLEQIEAGTERDRKLEKLEELLDELASQIYQVHQDNQRNLEQVQSNLIRRINMLKLEAKKELPQDPMELKRALMKDGVDINLSSRWVRVKGRFIGPDHPLELVAIVEGGKSHEAMIQLDCRPSAVRAGLTALGLKPGRGADWRTGAPPSGAPLFIYVTWEGLKRPWRLEDLLWDAKEDAAMTNPNWVFSGSRYDSDLRTGDEYFLADVNRCVIGIVHKFSNVAVITSAHKNAGDERAWFPNASTMPKPKGTRDERNEVQKDSEDEPPRRVIAKGDPELEITITISAIKQPAMEWR
ncbi:MAG: YdjY domain-containing protein [Planctomycetota bacterium]